jgi:anti-sigma B factor antagonist
MAAVSPDSFRTAVVASNDSVVVMLQGELDLHAAPSLARTLDEFVGGGRPLVVLDLSELTFVDSQGLSILIVLEQQLRERRQNLTIRAPRPAQLKLLEIMGLTEHLNVELP